MKKLVLALVSFIAIYHAQVAADSFDYDAFVKAYYQAQVATQQPDATQEDLEHYLSFLTDDVGNQHLPNAPDDSRQPDAVFVGSRFVHGDLHADVTSGFSFPHVGAFETHFATVGREAFECVAPRRVGRELMPAQGHGPVELILGGGGEVLRPVRHG